MKIILILSFFIFSFFSVFCQNVSNENVAVMECHFETCFNNDVNALLQDFAWDAYELSNENFNYGYNNIWNDFTSELNNLNYSNYQSYFIPSPFYSNRTTHTTLSTACSNYTIQDVNTYYVNDGIIKDLIREGLYSQNNSTSENSSNGSSNRSSNEYSFIKEIGYWILKLSNEYSFIKEIGYWILKLIINEIFEEFLDYISK